MTRTSPYSPEFREETVQLAVGSKMSIAQVARELGVNPEALRTWVRRAESFFGTLKNERVSRTSYPTRDTARRDSIRYIEYWYNRKLFHSALGYRPPREVHAEHNNLQLTA